MKGILVDTNVLYAALDTGDGNHERAQQDLKIVEDLLLPIYLPTPVLLEAYNLVRYRLGFLTAHGFLESCLRSTEMINPSSEAYFAAITKVSHYPDQNISLTDAVLAVLAEQTGLSVWTYDFHFDVMRVVVWHRP